MLPKQLSGSLQLSEKRARKSRSVAVALAGRALHRHGTARHSTLGASSPKPRRLVQLQFQISLY